MALEIERRFLVKLPLPWYVLFKLYQCTNTEIVQTYLTDPPNSRVRQCDIKAFGVPRRFEYFLTTKKTIATGINEEQEERLIAYQYAWKVVNKDKLRHEIRKVRYNLLFAKQPFELDIFRDRLKGLAILEIELDYPNQTVRIPPYLSIEKEVTGDDGYSNYNLSKLNSYIIPPSP